MNVSARMLILQEAIKNLLNAQKRIADSGSASDVIRITRFILKLVDKRDDVLINIVSEGDEEGRYNPV